LKSEYSTQPRQESVPGDEPKTILRNEPNSILCFQQKLKAKANSTQPRRAKTPESHPRESALISGPKTPSTQLITNHFHEIGFVRSKNKPSPRHAPLKADSR
jgi:hypothetical protein